MARTRREKGRPRANWDEDPAIVRAHREWAEKRKVPSSTVSGNRHHMRGFHDFIVKDLGLPRNYYDPENNQDYVTWKVAKAFQDHLVGRVEAGEIGRSVKNTWWAVVNFFEWRFASDQSKRNREDLENVKLFVEFPMKFDTSLEGEQPYALEHLWKIVESSRSYAMYGAAPQGGGIERPSEDYHFVLVLVYLGQRAEIFGLTWKEVHFDIGMVNPTAKGGVTWELAMHPELRKALEDLRSRKPESRMVFASGSFPWNKEYPHKGGSCEYPDCRVKKPLFEYYGRERDEIYCRKHLTRTCGAAQSANRSQVTSMMNRIERALHGLYPDLRETAIDKKGERFARPLHLTSHRFRKTVATFYIELGLTKEEAAKITGWKDPETIRRKYWKPELAAKQKIVDSMDIVKASAAADRGELEGMRKKSDLEKLTTQVSALTEIINRLSAQLAEKDAKIEELRKQSSPDPVAIGGDGTIGRATRDLVMQ